MCVCICGGNQIYACCHVPCHTLAKTIREFTKLVENFRTTLSSVCDLHVFFMTGSDTCTHSLTHSLDIDAPVPIPHVHEEYRYIYYHILQLLLYVRIYVILYINL